MQTRLVILRSLYPSGLAALVCLSACVGLTPGWVGQTGTETEATGADTSAQTSISAEDTTSVPTTTATTGDGSGSSDGVETTAGTTTGGPAADEVLIPAGSFMMGCNDAIDSDCESDESPYHEVTLSAFFIDTTEVTQAAYDDCIADSACTPPASDFDPAATPDHPVVSIDWDQATAYCAWAGRRLPTEAEWEKAARGDDGRLWPWGNDVPTCERGNYDPCVGTSVAVASYPAGASPFGVFDMAGNVSEWVSDWYDSAYYTASPTDDPTGPAVGSARSIRGSSFNFGVTAVRVSNRIEDAPSSDSAGRGFRCARPM